MVPARRRWPGAWSMRSTPSSTPFPRVPRPYEGDGKTLDVPAIVGIGGSLLYFVEKYRDKGSAYEDAFDWLGEANPYPEGVGFYYLDHLTHNVFSRQHGHVWDFYRDMFGFKQIHFFDIDGRITGLMSRAITSPCGKIRIPLNESKDENSQIEEYLKKYKGEGIQHIRGRHGRHLRRSRTGWPKTA